MKRFLAACAAALMLWAASARAKGPQEFYAWAESVVAFTEFLPSQGTFLIHMQPVWEDPSTPWNYRLWLGGYTVCKNYPPELRFDSAVLLYRVSTIPDYEIRTNFPIMGIMRFEHCKTFLENIEDEVRGQ